MRGRSTKWLLAAAAERQQRQQHLAVRSLPKEQQLMFPAQIQPRSDKQR